MSHSLWWYSSNNHAEGEFPQPSKTTPQCRLCDSPAEYFLPAFGIHTDCNVSDPIFFDEKGKSEIWLDDGIPRACLDSDSGHEIFLCHAHIESLATPSSVAHAKSLRERWEALVEQMWKGNTKP